MHRFLSTPSARRATFPVKSSGSAGAISIHALREEGDKEKKPDEKPAKISIHALREEGDKVKMSNTDVTIISIHALREEGDFFRKVVFSRKNRFLSTPSARRATAHTQRSSGIWTDFYPRPPRGGRPDRVKEEPSPEQFLSTPSARRATT